MISRFADSVDLAREAAGSIGLGGGAADAESHETEGNPYVQGRTVNVLNPQVALFFLAFLPAFAPEAASALGMFVLGALYAVITAVYLGSACSRGRWAAGGPGSSAPPA